jgi:surface antigen
MKLLLPPLAVLVAVPVLIGSTAGAVATAPRPSPAHALFASVPPGGYSDHFPYGQCTWWAAYNRLVTWNGNAGDWLANAAAQDVEISTTPTVGAIAVYPPQPGYSSYGHVAVVVAVTAASYSVSEMNYLGWGRVDQRTIAWPDSKVAGFIPLQGQS